MSGRSTSRAASGCWGWGASTITPCRISSPRTPRRLDELFVQVRAGADARGAVNLERVAHDGTKIRAAASRKSFKREERLAECRRLAEEHLAALQQQSRGRVGAARRKAQQRAARERRERVRQAAAGTEAATGGEGAGRAGRGAGQRHRSEARIMRQGDGGFAPSYNRADLHRQHGAA